MIVPSTEQDKREVARLIEESRGPAPKIPVLNTELILGLYADSILFFRGWRLRVPPIEYREGVRMNALWRDFAAMAKDKDEGGAEKDDAYLALLRQMAECYRRVVTPKGWIQKVMWRFARNPFLKMTEGDVGKLMGFFFACRMRSSALMLDPSEAQPQSMKI